jgi:hypothetical protein
MIVNKLRQHNIDAVLVGGSVVSIYTANKYASDDLDFISPAAHDRIVTAMAELGFDRAAGGTSKSFLHPGTRFTVEFPTGPLALGETAPVTAEGSIEVDGITIKMLSPTQCVMDRLLWFFYCNDRQCLDQAVWVAQAHPISIKKLRAWASREPNPESVQQKLQIFLARISDS